MLQTNNINLSFLPPTLLGRLEKKAQESNIPINSLITTLLWDSLLDEPNETTLEAMKEAESGKIEETLEMSHFDDFLESL